MAKIEVISTTLIHPNIEHKKKIELTSNDVPFLLVGPFQKGLLFSKPNSSQVHHILQTSLSSTLEIFFPFAGRFSTTLNEDNTVCFSVDCNNAGVQYVQAVARDITISDILDSTYIPPFIPSLFPLNGSKNHQGTFNPLLAIQVTELTDGIFIGCTINHSVSDGTTFWNFMNTWSEICRCSSDDQSISKTLPEPVFENWFRGNSNCHTRLDVSMFETSDQFTPPPFRERIFHFRREKIAELKSKANIEAATERRNIKISSLQSLLAHIWRSVIRCGEPDLDPEEETIFRFIVGLRSRLGMPEGYFGNAIQFATLKMKVKQLEEKGIGEVSLAINEVVGSFTEEKVRKDLEESIKNPEIIRLGGFVRNALIMTSSPRFNVYGNDFGWGKPIAVRSGSSNKFDGMLTLYPGMEEGSLDVEVCSSFQVLEAMALDSEFMNFVTI
ncbi:HXXXD-type acyl-transferase family protein [Euphorbia peplus]|nr:HXXXD-type acyl-transferase family protein [Euphorbia peplus]